LPAVERAAQEERCVLLALLAGREIVLDAQEVKAAVRRAELLLAAGGDPRRPLELRGRAVTAVAADLDAPAARRLLRTGLEDLQGAATRSPVVTAALQRLIDDDDLAWQCFAFALVAEALAGEVATT
jgi:hypothetical protein